MEPNKKKKIIDLGILPEDAMSGVTAIALVEEPAIEVDFLAFKKENFVHPSAGENHDDFINRCMPVVVGEGNESDQAYAICESYWSEKMAKSRVSFDYDDTLSTARGKELAKKAINAEEDVYIISARDNKDGMLATAQALGIPSSRVYATGSNAAKIEKIKELGIDKHYDNNQDVIDALGETGMKFDIDTTGLAPYEAPFVPEKPKKRIEDVLSPAKLETILELAATLGVSMDQIDFVQTKFAQDPKDADYTHASTITKADGVEYLYKYNGGRNSNSRAFCQRMVALRRMWSREEIDALDSFNEEFGPGVGGGSYSIFKYKGGVNCQHSWQKYAVERVGKRLQATLVAPTDNIELQAATALRNQQGNGYVKRPQRNEAPLGGGTDSFSKLLFADEEQHVVVGPCMIPDINIPRRDEDGEIYFVKFSAETIKEIAMKYMKEARTNDINQDHIEDKDAGTYVFETWIIEDAATDKANTVYGYDLPVGTWMCKMKVDDPEVWRRIKAGELRGLSVEGLFADMEELEARKKYEKIKRILKG